MPPMYINIGAYVGDETLIDSHALVGSCAQIGRRVHISAAAQIGGVLEPVGALPVVIEDDVLVGGNCGIYEGAIVKRRAVLASGTILTASTPIYDLPNARIIDRIRTVRSSSLKARLSCPVHARSRAAPGANGASASPLPSSSSTATTRPTSGPRSKTGSVRIRGTRPARLATTASRA